MLIGLATDASLYRTQQQQPLRMPYDGTRTRGFHLGLRLGLCVSDNIVPFGKYRGQPIEALASDRQYTDWLTAQPWFRDRYSSLYTIVINNFAPPADTPEHNAIQARLLSFSFCLKLIEAAFPRWLIEQAESVVSRYAPNLGAYGVTKDQYYSATRFIAEPTLNGPTTHYVEFETRGVDAIVSAGCAFAYIQVRLEIKPSLGDDYPTVLRQMKRGNANVLLLGEYVGIGVSEETLIALFKNERISIVFLSDLL